MVGLLPGGQLEAPDELVEAKYGPFPRSTGGRQRIVTLDPHALERIAEEKQRR